MDALQNYWWFLISLLGGLLVALLFVQGGQSLLPCQKSENDRNFIIGVLGAKWELTFTTLVVFGGAFFASFPLFYSTSFGGAYWLWMLILFSFIVQAFSYEFRKKKGNLTGAGFYEGLLTFNGFVGPFLLGIAVGTMFFGADFTVSRSNLTQTANPVISQWGPSHGLEAIICWKNIILGLTILFLARFLGALYILKSTAHTPAFAKSMRKHSLVSGALFVVFFLATLALLLTKTGFQMQPDGNFTAVDYLIAHNLVDLWWIALTLVIGVVLVLFGYITTLLKSSYRKGFWPCALGTVMAVTSLLCLIGYNGSAYYPSLIEMQDSLCLANSSSSEFTLTVMSWVSAFIPVVVLYIGYVWYKMSAKPLTQEELNESSH